MTTRPKPPPTADTGFHFLRRNKRPRPESSSVEPKSDSTPGEPGNLSAEQHPHHSHHLPIYNHKGHKVTRGIQPDGESGRRGVHPLHFIRIVLRSTSSASALVNVLWPVVPAAIAVHFARPEWHLVIFILNYIAMVPAANLIGFAGQELARKLPKVAGVVLETTLGSVVEIILFMVLIKRAKERENEPSSDSYLGVIRAAILGSVLANLLLCLGLCFFVGGMIREEQVFHEAVSEVGNGLLLVAGMGLIIPVAYNFALADRLSPADLSMKTTEISRAAAIILLIAFVVYVWFQLRSHHGLYDELLEADEQADADRHKDLAKDKLTLTECVLALVIALACVSMIAVFLVLEIEPIIESRGVTDAFMGLILVPLVEKFAEHLTAIDEAWDNQANFALIHVLGATLQTALLNTPLVILVGWGLGLQMNLNFEVFDAIVLILAIIVVGNFLRDGKSNYLEGTLCVFVYVLIAVCAFYYPSPEPGEETASEGSGPSEGNATSVNGTESSAAPTEMATEAAKMLIRAAMPSMR
ncbi:hypothetical protein EV356DRAFT_497243 [Viridothelium virens]|uniref:Vacuolar calcium ion transporter n=1 Tax=Viridothelium virens TaxID=1048519 RepID=A0A6A6HFU7_VIRVR|nr:hypothetical protein EV356DRAFT_497243 [Viridothelium virens]